MTEFSAPEKVRVLLAEYTALRSEIVARMNHGYQLLLVAIAALAFVVTIYERASWRLLLFVGASMTVVYVFSCWFSLRDMYKLAARVREIELDVNDRCGEDLLLWENLSGGARTAFWSFNARSRAQLEHVPNPIRTRKGKPLVAAPTTSQPAPSNADMGNRHVTP